MVAKQQRMNAGVSSQMAKPNKMSKGVTYGALSDAEKNRLKNNQSRAKNVYPSTAWLAAKWAKVAASKIASWAKKIASGVKNAVNKGSSTSAKWNKMTAKHTSRSFPKAEPYYDYRTKSTKWGTDVRIGELPRKAKRK